MEGEWADVGLRQGLDVVRKRWRLLTTVALVTLAIASALTLMAPKSYQSSTQVFVSVRDGSTNADLVSGNTFAQSQVQSYIDVVTSPLVLDPVIQQLNMSDSANELKSQLTVTVPERTVLMNITAEDEDPRRASLLANAVTRQFASTVGNLETPTNAGGSPVRITVLKNAQPSATPVSPQPMRNLLLGALLGLLLGVAAAFVREMLDSTVSNERQVREAVDSPLIGNIPNDPTTSRYPLITDGGHKNIRSEAFRALRTNLQFVMAGSRSKSLVLTSSMPNEGKTTTAANLALSLAAQGARVCVVECDLRRPRLLRYLGMEGAFGLTSVLIGEADLDDVLQQFGSSSLWVVGCGPIPPNPSELLGSPQMNSVLRELEGKFDFVILDAPPLLPVTDAAVLSKQVGGTVLVAGLGRIERTELATAQEALLSVDANLLGVIVNMVPTRGPGGYRYYRDGYQSVSQQPVVVDDGVEDVGRRRTRARTKVR